MGLSKISIWRGEMDMQKSIKSLKRNGILLLAYDLLVLCIVFVKNGMTNMSAEAVTSLIVSIGFGIFTIYSGSWIPKLGLLITEKGNVSGLIGVAKLYFCC